MRYTNSSDAFERTTDNVLRDMALALEYSMPINGYKGPSPAVKLSHFDLVWGFTVEYIHAVLLGATRQITEELLSSSSSNKRYYIGGFRPKVFEYIIHSPLSWQCGGTYAAAVPINHLLFTSWPRSARACEQNRGSVANDENIITGVIVLLLSLHYQLTGEQGM